MVDIRVTSFVILVAIFAFASVSEAGNANTQLADGTNVWGGWSILQNAVGSTSTANTANTLKKACLSFTNTGAAGQLNTFDFQYPTPVGTYLLSILRQVDVISQVTSTNGGAYNTIDFCNLGVNSQFQHYKVAGGMSDVVNSLSNQCSLGIYKIVQSTSPQSFAVNQLYLVLNKDGYAGRPSKFATYADIANDIDATFYILDNVNTCNSSTTLITGFVMTIFAMTIAFWNME